MEPIFDLFLLGMKELQDITKRIARHQRDHLVGPRTDIKLIMVVCPPESGRS